jgi:hypothetical protein
LNKLTAPHPNLYELLADPGWPGRTKFLDELRDICLSAYAEYLAAASQFIKMSSREQSNHKHGFTGTLEHNILE